MIGLISTWLLKLRLIEKQDILEKSCKNKIFIISDFNGGVKNGKNVIRLAVHAVSAWRFLWHISALFGDNCTGINLYSSLFQFQCDIFIYFLSSIHSLASNNNYHNKSDIRNIIYFLI
jgi:hypothetical protein